MKPARFTALTHNLVVAYGPGQVSDDHGRTKDIQKKWRTFTLLIIWIFFYRDDAPAKHV
jgi:hypothetical protein